MSLSKSFMNGKKIFLKNIPVFNKNFSLDFNVDSWKVYTKYYTLLVFICV